MALKKLSNGSVQVYIYSAETKRKEYRGVRGSYREAQKLERELMLERDHAPATSGPTVAEYAHRWLTQHHGPNTRRPAPTSLQVNETNLRRFLHQFGDQPLGSIGRAAALDWSREPGNQHRAKSISAMFNDAVDDELVTVNPFANRRQTQPRGRRDIHPLTEHEVDTLAAIALDRWGPDGYGQVFRAAILFGAWVGTRPGETFAVTWRDLDLREGLVTVRRVKPPYHEDVVVLPSIAADAIQGMPRIPNQDGIVFPSIRGDRISRAGGLRYYWDPVRSAFRQTVTPERWADLCEGQPDLAWYSLRHFAASIIVARGGNEYDVSAQLGNTPEVARETYVHAYVQTQQERLRGLLERPAPVVDITKARRGA
jgi:integrase